MWFVSHQSNHQAIKIGSILSELSKFICRVPPRICVGTTVSIYTAPLRKILGLHYEMKFHFHADDTQLYVHLSNIRFYCATIAYHVELNANSGGRRYPANVQEK